MISLSPLLLVTPLLLLSAPVKAQLSIPNRGEAAAEPNRIGRTSDVKTGRVGERQTLEEASRITGVEPLRRIDNRIANRVQSRLRSRIDRNYDPWANATAPFKDAEAQRLIGRRPR